MEYSMKKIYEMFCENHLMDNITTEKNYVMLGHDYDHLMPYIEDDSKKVDSVIDVRKKYEDALDFLKDMWAIHGYHQIAPNMPFGDAMGREIDYIEAISDYDYWVFYQYDEWVKLIGEEAYFEMVEWYEITWQWDAQNFVKNMALGELNKVMPKELFLTVYSKLDESGLVNSRLWSDFPDVIYEYCDVRAKLVYISKFLERESAKLLRLTIQSANFTELTESERNQIQNLCASLESDCYISYADPSWTVALGEWLTYSLTRHVFEYNWLTYPIQWNKNQVMLMDLLIRQWWFVHHSEILGRFVWVWKDAGYSKVNDTVKNLRNALKKKSNLWLKHDIFDTKNGSIKLKFTG